MANDSIYIPLPLKSPTIRLLDLQPGEWGERIEVDLRESTIDKASNRYTTISYNWGTIETTKQVFITCNGRQVPISENLFTILRRLRRPDYSILVWADALCINQSDTLERTHQVELMGEIYRNSRETVIWLGEQTQMDDVGQRFLGHCINKEDRETLRWGGPPRIVWTGGPGDRNLLDMYLFEYAQSRGKAGNARMSMPNEMDLPLNDIFGAFCLIYSLAQGISSQAIQFLEDDNVKEFAEHTFPTAWHTRKSKTRHVHGSRSTRVWFGFDRLMSRPWWTRIWVIQETVLAQKATVHYGMLSMPWSMFAAAATHYEQERHTMCLDLAGTLSGHDLLNRFSNSVMQIDNIRRHHQATLDDVTLLSLLWKFRSLEASDKRDKVFALLGLTTNWQGLTPMLPDYQIDVGMTFIQTAVNTIQRSGTLSVLAGDLDAGLGRKRLKGIPSWVMDWALPCLQLETERVSSLEMYDASGGHSGTVRLHQLHSILDVEGAYVDDVVAIGETSRHTQISDTCAVIREWNFLMKGFEAANPEYPTGCTYQEAFWRTLLGDIVHTGQVADTHRDSIGAQYRRAKSDDFEAFQAWRMWSRCISRDTWGRTASFTQRDLDEGISSIHYALKAATASRRFFITHHGYMGIGPKSTMPGDKLYVFQNCKMPFLVRPHGLKGCVGMGCTTLIAPDDASRDSTGVCEEVHSCYRLVGDCFAFGLMDGEAFQNPRANIRRIFLV